MSEYKRSVIVIPGFSLEELPANIESEHALDFLNAWTSQWDPRILRALSLLPEWKRADYGSLDLEDALVLCPTLARSQVDQPMLERLEYQRCKLIESQNRERPALVAALLDEIGGADLDKTPLLLDDFYALGYAVLQVQILARKLRYSWNIDWIAFTEQVLSAANASLSNQEDEAERWIQTCFDSISQERDRYCSQQAYLLDFVLMASSTLGDSLTQQLSIKHPISLLSSSKLLRTLEKRNPSAFERVKELVTSRTISLVGGLDEERKHPYFSAAALLRELAFGIASYARLGLNIPIVFSRYESGFTSSLPTFLTQFGYEGAILSAWSDGSVPESDQAKVKWQSSSDSKSLDTVIGHVLDASSADTYIRLADHLAKQLDYHHVPTVVLAHWPGLKLSPWNDLMRVAARSPALGKFVSAETYFSETSSPYSCDNYPSTAFKLRLPDSPKDQNALHQRIIAYQKLRVPLERLESMFYLWSNIGGKKTQATPEYQSLQKSIDEINASLDRWFDRSENEQSVPTESLEAADIANRCKAIKQELLHWIRPQLESNIPNAEGVNSHVLLNPSNHATRVFLDDVEGQVNPASCSRILASEWDQNHSRVIVDLPPFGFVHFESTPVRTLSSDNDPPKASFWKRVTGKRLGIADTDWTLSNEFMEIQIDPKRGHLRSVYVANKRGSRLSGMASIAMGKADVSRKWSDNDCLEIANVTNRLVKSSPLIGVIESTGDCRTPNGRTVRVATTFTLWKGSRWLDVSVRAENIDLEQLSCVWRTAWLNEAALVYAWQHGIRGKLSSPLQSSVELIEIDDAEHKVFIAPIGLSAHRRSESRFLVSHLPVSEDGTVSARFAIGMDWPRPFETSLDLLDQPWLLKDASGSKTVKPSDTSAWMAQCSLSNVHFYFMTPRPTLEAEWIPEPDRERLMGKDADCCLWIQETQGKSGAGRLSFYRDVAEAWRADFQGREYSSLPVSDGQVILSVTPNEQSRILLRWQRGASSAK